MFFLKKKKYKSNISPIAIKRVENNYNDISCSGDIVSATAIRNIIKNGNIDILNQMIPSSSFNILLENIKTGHIVPDLSLFEKEIIYNLRKMDISEISNIPDVSEGLEFSIKNTANCCNSLVEFLNIIKSKRYTSTRIQRILLHSLLGITKKDIIMSKKTNPYIRVLGFNKKGQFLISEITKANPKLKIVTSVKRFIDSNSNKNLELMLNKDIFATNIYTIGYKYDSWSNLDFTKKIITE